MAEIGLVGSLVGVVAVGTSVAKQLYEMADVMIHANQQLLSLAKHVSQFTAVLKHMGQVLKTEKANCSKEILRDVRKIKHSCKRTFREIDSAMESKRFPHFVALRWLFKRTKAMELEARLDSQQSMLQCMIHTLTVSKLGQIDSRSKQDSEHITDLKVEIKFLKTLVMENNNNLRELRRAEQSTEAEARYQPVSGGGSHPGHNPYGHDSTFPSNPVGGSNAYELPIMLSPSPTSGAFNPDNEDPNSDDGADDDANYTKHKDRNDQDGTGPMGDTSNAEGLVSRYVYQPRSSYNDASGPSMHRESNSLLQMVPYSPRFLDPIRSGRFISGRQLPDSGAKSATQEATNSVRLLLEKWTTSGSAPVSNVLDEEAAGDKSEAELANKRETSGPRSDTYRRSSSPGAESDADDFGPSHYPERPGYSRRFRDDHMPPPPPWNNSQSQYGYPSYEIHPFSQLSLRQLGNEILTALRSTRGGIHYTKNNQFMQVHYVDQYPIYTCAFVPSHMVPDNEWKFLNTELGRGLIRREALDLLGYSYTETEMGKFSISGDLELREIEELVKLSYKALDKIFKERSKKVIEERGWGEAISAMNLGMYSNEPFAAPQYPPPMQEPWDQNKPIYDGYTGHRPYNIYENVLPDNSASSQAPPSNFRPRDHPSALWRGRPISISPPTEVKHREREAMRKTRPELRFTLPRAQAASGTADIAKKAHPSPVKPRLTPTKTDDELQNARQKLEQVQKRKEEAEKVGDHSTVSDMIYFVIPELEMQIKKLRKMQREEQKEPAVSPSRNEEGTKLKHTLVETDSEDSDDDLFERVE